MTEWLQAQRRLLPCTQVITHTYDYSYIYIMSHQELAHTSWLIFNQQKDVVSTN